MAKKQLVNKVLVELDLKEVKNGDLLIYDNGVLKSTSLDKIVSEFNLRMQNDLIQAKNDYLVAQANYEELVRRLVRILNEMEAKI